MKPALRACRGAAPRALGALVLGCALLAGCALPGSADAPQFRDGHLVRRPAGLPQRAAVHGVAFYPDAGDACGPASLAELLRFSGVDTDPGRLSPQLLTPGLDGTLQPDMLGATRRAGRVAYVIDPDLGALMQDVAAGWPVLVLQRLGVTARTWHFAVVVGYDLDRDTITLRSSTARRLVLSIGTFDATWSGAGRWGFVALPPGVFAPGTTMLRYLEAVAPMEGVAPQAARRAYQDALRRWPQAWVAMMGLGNLAYARHDYAQAARRFAQAARAHPGDGDPLNNLAQARLAAGQFAAARDAIERARGIGTPNPAVYARTRRQIQRAAAAHALAPRPGASNPQR